MFRVHFKLLFAQLKLVNSYHFHHPSSTNNNNVNQCNITIKRNYARIVRKITTPNIAQLLEPLQIENKPGAKVKNSSRQAPAHAAGRADYNNLHPNFKESIQELTEDGLEPNLEAFSFNYDEYLRDQEYIYEKQRRAKMIRKHFSYLQPPELNLLTHAEKEKIRYLHAFHSWSPEMISDSFPISVPGVRKLLKGKSCLRTQEDIIRHDEGVVERLQRIQDGEIELNEELEARLSRRSQLPVFVGAVWNPELCRGFDGMAEGGFDMTHKEKSSKKGRIVGEFEALVTPSSPGPAQAETKENFNAQQQQQFLLSAAPAAKSNTKGKKERNWQQIDLMNPNPPTANKMGNKSGSRFKASRSSPSFESDLDSIPQNLRPRLRHSQPYAHGGGGAEEEEQEFWAKNKQPNRRLTFNEFAKIFKKPT